MQIISSPFFKILSVIERSLFGASIGLIVTGALTYFVSVATTLPISTALIAIVASFFCLIASKIAKFFLDKVKDDMINIAISTPEGRKALAEALINCPPPDAEKELIEKRLKEITK